MHLGYGFLSENAELRAKLQRRVCVSWAVAEVIKTFGLKHEARAIAESQGVPVLRGTDILPDRGCADRGAG